MESPLLKELRRVERRNYYNLGDVKEGISVKNNYCIKLKQLQEIFNRNIKAMPTLFESIQPTLGVFEGEYLRFL